MPDCVRFCKLNGSELSQFAVEKRESETALFSTVLYGFRHCPYCGEKVVD